MTDPIEKVERGFWNWGWGDGSRKFIKKHHAKVKRILRRKVKQKIRKFEERQYESEQN